MNRERYTDFVKNFVKNGGCSQKSRTLPFPAVNFYKQNAAGYVGGALMRACAVSRAGFLCWGNFQK